MRNECGENTYVEHLLLEHRRLDHLVRRTLNALAACGEEDSTGWQLRVIEGLTAIRQELATHFAEEEAGGCLEEAVARCPVLSKNADRVEAEQCQLLEVLDELTGHCRNIVQPTRRDLLALDHELRALVHRLRLHEAEENRIMQQAFAVCLESSDSADAGSTELRPTLGGHRPTRVS